MCSTARGESRRPTSSRRQHVQRSARRRGPRRPRQAPLLPTHRRRKATSRLDQGKHAMRAALVVLALALLPISVGAQDGKADAEHALRQIDAFTRMQASTDPHYTAVEETMLTEV